MDTTAAEILAWIGSALAASAALAVFLYFFRCVRTDITFNFGARVINSKKPEWTPSAYEMLSIV